MKKQYVVGLFFFLELVCTAAAQSGNQLATIAKAMAPGTWAQVPQNNSLKDTLACGGRCGAGAGTGNRIIFSMNAGWDYVNEVLHFLGQDHGLGEPVTNHGHYFQFSAATNTWTQICGDAPNYCAAGWTDLSTSSAGSTTLATNGTFNATLLTNTYLDLVDASVVGKNFVGGMYKVVSVTDSHHLVLARSPTPNAAGENGLGYLGAFTHGYNMVTVDSRTGAVYFKEYGSGISQIQVFKYLNGTWSVVGVLDPAYHGPDAITWWPGSSMCSPPVNSATCNGGLGASAPYTSDVGGSLVYFISEVTEILGYSPARNRWFAFTQRATPAGAAGVYQAFVEYSEPFNLIVYGGGNTSSGGNNFRKLWKMDRNGNINSLLDAPIDLGVYHGGNVTVDPVTGHLIVVTTGARSLPGSCYVDSVYELDPSGTGSWTNITRTSAPPANSVYSPISNGSTGCAGNGLISAPVRELGVIMYVGCKNSTCNMWLYKHASPGHDGPAGNLRRDAH